MLPNQIRRIRVERAGLDPEMLFALHARCVAPLIEETITFGRGREVDSESEREREKGRERETDKGEGL